MIDGWKSCENCEDQYCYSLMKMEGLPVESACLDWKPLRCRCGGALSTTKEHNGKKYRHCYSCHFEFEI